MLTQYSGYNCRAVGGIPHTSITTGMSQQAHNDATEERDAKKLKQVEHAEEV